MLFARYGYPTARLSAFSLRMLSPAVLLALAAAAGAASDGIPPPPPDGLSVFGAPDTVEPLRPPETVDGLKRLRDELTAELARLAPTTQPTTTTATRPADTEAAREPAATLYGVLQQLVGHVDAHIMLRTALADLASPERLEARTREQAAIQQRIREIEDLLQAPPAQVSDADLKQVQDELDTVVREIAVRSSQRTERLETLRAAQNLRQEARDAARKAEAVFEAQKSRLLAGLGTTEDPDDRDRILLQLRSAAIQASLALFDEVRIRLSEERDVKLEEQAERRLPALRTLAARLGEWRGKLREILSGSERKRIEEEIAFIDRHKGAVGAYERTYWEARLVELNARDEFDRREREIRARFPRSVAEETRQEMLAERAYWALFLDSLHRRPSEHIRERYREMQDAVVKWQKRLAKHQKLLDNTVDEQQELTILADAFDEQLRKLDARFNAELNHHLLKHPGDIQAEYLSQKFAVTRHRFAERVQSLQADEKELISRLKETTASLASFVEEMRRYKSRLYWHHLRVPAYPIWAYRWGQTRAEWHSERERQERAVDCKWLRRWLSLIHI